MHRKLQFVKYLILANSDPLQYNQCQIKQQLSFLIMNFELRSFVPLKFDSFSACLLYGLFEP